jgi:hypothetical protein
MEMFYPCDRVITDALNPQLPVAEIVELNQVMQCNLEFSDESENYLNGGNELPNHISVIDEMEMFMRDAECEVWK